MIIFGWGSGRPKDRGAVAPSRCPTCGNEDYFRHISSTRWFSLFFIPLIPYSTKHFLLCPVCTRGRQLTREQAAKADEMVGWTERYRTHQISGEEYAGRVAAFLAYLRPIDAGPPGRPVAPSPAAIDAPPPSLPAAPDAASAEHTPMKACDACQCPLPDHAHFCPNCGRPADA